MTMKRIRDWSIRTKITFISLFTILLLLTAIVGFLLPVIEENMLAEKVAATRNVVQTALGAVARFHALEKEGKLTEDQAKKDAMGALRDFRYSDNEYFWIHDNTLTMLMHPFKPELNGKNLSDFKDPNGKFLFREMTQVAMEKGGGSVSYMWPKPGSPEPEPKVSYVVLYRPWGWIIGSGIYVDDLKAQLAALRNKIFLGAAILTIAILALSVWMSRRITQPLHEAVSVARRLAEGDLSARVDDCARDEMGDMCRALNGMAKEFNGICEDMTGGVKTLSSASSSMSGVSSRLKSSVKEQTVKTGLVQASASHMSANMESVAAAMTQAAGNVSMLSVSTEQMTATIREISSNTARARAVTDVAVENVEATTKVVNHLNESSQAIAKVTGTIAEISNQTKLLALNATIEAARAGEAGKGFAVVAHEIKELAKQTADATQEISTILQGVRSSTASAVEAIGKVGGVVREVDTIVVGIAAAVEEQSTTAGLIADNVLEASHMVEEVRTRVMECHQVSQSVASDISKVDTSAKTVAENAQNIDRGVEELTALADRLEQVVGNFTLAGAAPHAKAQVIRLMQGTDDDSYPKKYGT